MAFDVKITTFFRPLDLIAPFTCRGCGALGEVLCDRCKNYNILAIPDECPRCKKTRKGCKCAVSVFAVSKREGILVDLTEDYKYKSIRRTAEVLAELVDTAIMRGDDVARGGKRESASGCKNGISSENVAVVPLPTINKHIRERGFDHTLLIAKKLAKRHNGWKVEKLLLRRNKTVQVGTDGDKRRAQAKKAYEVDTRAVRRIAQWEGVTKSENINDLQLDPTKTYLLVDDVWTTGASMEAAIELMKKAGAKKLAGAVILIP